MRTHRDIIKDAKATKVAKRFNIEPGTVHAWVRSDSIPGGYWPAFAEAGFATLDELAAAALEKLKARGLAPEVVEVEAAA